MWRIWLLWTNYETAASGVGLGDVVSAVSGFLSIDPDGVVGPSKERIIVRARVLVCYWAVRELGMTMTDVAKNLKISVPTVSVAVRRGFRYAQEEGLKLAEI